MDEHPTTTTISTIAIRAGNRSSIVVALLKSIGYISLRIDEMQPGILELGENADETADLIAIHDDLMNRLKSKEDQVEELLARADNLVTQQKDSDVIVYEAMAESLGSAWKELNRQLQMRGFLLGETLRFYEFARKHERLAANAKSLLNSSRINKDGDDLRSIAQQLQKCYNELIEVTANAVDSGADVISQIRILGSTADNVERGKETVDACLKIEKAMLILAAEWETLEEAWKTERAKLKVQLDESAELLSRIEDIEKWLKNARNQLKTGVDPNILIQQAFQQRLVLHDIMHSIDRDRLTHLSGRTTNLQNDIELFIGDLERIQKDFERVRSFITNANSLLNQLSSMEMDIRNANAAMAGELAPLARQRAQTVIDQGRPLISIDDNVPRLIKEIENKVTQIESLARERINAASDYFNKELRRLENWLINAEQFVASHGRMGTNLSEANAFYTSHKEFSTEFSNKEIELNTLMSKAHEFNESDRKKLGDFHSRFQSLKRLVEGRAQLGNAFQQVHKFAKELEGSFESLDALISSNRNFSNERLTNQMSEVFRMIQETLIQECHQGEKFVSTAESLGATDTKLEVNQASDSVRKILDEHERRFSSITESWKRWQQSRVQEQKVVRIVEEIQMWQEETLEIIRTLEEKVEKAEKTLVVTELQEVKTKMDDVLRSIPRQKEKIVEAESIAKISESEEAYDRMRMAKRRQKEVEDRITQLRQKVDVVEEFIVQKTTEVVRAPEILTYLRDAQVDEGNRFEFAARVEGEPTPTIQWLKDGRDVKDNVDYRTAYVNGTATLTIDETFVEDTATYTLRAQNKAGRAETSARLVVKSRSEMGSQIEEETKPRFLRQLRSMSVFEGETALLDCVLVGYPEPRVVWYKEEETIKESERINLLFEGDHCSLTIRDTVPSDSGLYTVKATNIIGETTNFCRLTVHPTPKPPPPPTPPKPQLMVPPSFAPTLVNQIVREGQRSTFQVRVMGEPTPQLQWKFNEEPIRTSNEVKIIEESNGWSRLIIENAKPQNSGMYTVFAQNAAGEARSGATLVVEPKPIPIQMPKTTRETIVKTTTSEGFWSDSAVMASPTPPPIPKHRQRTEIEEYNEILRSEYAISPTATAPEFIRPFQNEYTAMEGEKFKMECTMVGNPRPKVFWYFNDRIINVNSKFCSFSNVGDTYSIILEPAKLENAGIYKMTAENVRGKTETVTVLHVRPRSFPQYQVSKKPVSTQHVQVTEEFGAFEYEQIVPERRTLQREHIEEEFGMFDEDRRVAIKHPSQLTTPPPAKKQLTTEYEQEKKVLESYTMEETRPTGHPPHFTQTLVSAVAVFGDSAKFEGIVTGWPSPEVQWTKDGVIITKETNPELLFSNIGGRVSLTFPSAELEHAGKYMCTAKNASGVATSSAQLVVRPKTIAPDFVRRLISEEIVEGDQLKWLVQVTGDPTPKVTWLRDGQIIPNCDEVQLLDEGNGVHSMVIIKVELADCGQFTCLAENVAGEARSTADLVVRPIGTEPGNYFHVTKVTQEKKVKGEEVARNESLAIENPKGEPLT